MYILDLFKPIENWKNKEVKSFKRIELSWGQKHWTSSSNKDTVPCSWSLMTQDLDHVYQPPRRVSGEHHRQARALLKIVYQNAV